MAQGLADLAREQAERKKKEAATNPAVEGLKAATPPPMTVTIIGGGKTPEQLKREAAVKAQAEAIALAKTKNAAKKQAKSGSLR